MRTRTDNDTDKGIMDPLWEFILDDHDEVATREENSNRRRNGSFRGARKVPETSSRKEEIGFFDNYFNYDSDYSDEMTYDNRDDGISNRKTNDSAKRGGDSSIWDMFGGRGADSRKSAAAAAATFKTSWSRSNGKFSKSARTSSRQSQTAESDKATKSTGAGDKPAKKGGLFRRLRRKDKDIQTPIVNKVEANPNTDVAKPSKSPTEAEASENYAKQLSESTKIPEIARSSQGNTKSILKSSQVKEKEEKTDNNDEKDEFNNPFRLFMDLVEAFDPFASEDSDSDSAASEGADESVTNETYANAAADLDKLVLETRDDSRLVEVRLNFSPAAEERFQDEEENSQTVGPAHVEERGVCALEDNLITETTTSEQNRNMESSCSGADVERDYIGELEKFKVERDCIRELEKFKELDARTLTTAPSRSRDRESHDRVEKKEASHSFGLKRLSCRSTRNEDKESSLPAHMISIPASRAVQPSEGEYPKFFEPSPEDDHRVRGFPTVDAKEKIGPQAFYEYDYASQENSDVYYSALGLHPRTSMLVRKLGGPPLLDPSNVNDEVLVRIKASTVSESDCIIRQGLWRGAGHIPSANTPGVEIVGEIYDLKPQVASKYDLHVSQTVISLTKWGGNGRFMAIHPTKLIKVPPGIDPILATCLPETYLTAFQVLHLDHNSQTRYARSSMRGKSILVVGSMSNNMGKAIIELALNAGVANIFATAKQKHWKTLIAFGIMPLSTEPSEWIQRVEGTIDLVLASNGELREDVEPIHFRALRPKTGKLIMCGRRLAGNDVATGSAERNPASLVCAKNKEQLKMLNRSFSFDIFEQWEKNLELCQKDLVHLLELLQDGAIKPKILDRIPLGKVPRAHELLETKRLSGFLICEPWMVCKKRAVYL